MTNYARMSMIKPIRPFDRFEAVYQGLAGTVPIAFPGTLDAKAGKPGYAANLLAGVAVPLGGRLLIQIPMTIDTYTSEPNYAYQFLWRTRNQQSFNEAFTEGRVPTDYHLPSDQPGRRERQGDGPGADLLFIPAGSDIEIFEQTEPVGDGAATLNVRQQIYVPKLATSWAQPLLSSGDAAIWQQGAYQYSSNVNCGGPTWFPIWLDAAGDELMVLVYKTDSVSPWDFAGDDKAFSNTYGTNDAGLPNNPNIGLLISSGTMGG